MLKIIYLALFIFLLTGCNEKIDATNNTRLSESLVLVRASLSDKDLGYFDSYVARITDDFERESRYLKEPELARYRAKSFSKIHNKTGIELVKYEKELLIENYNKKLSEIKESIENLESFIKYLSQEASKAELIEESIDYKVNNLFYRQVKSSKCGMSYLFCDYLELEFTVTNNGNDIIQDLSIGGHITIDKNIELEINSESMRKIRPFLNFKPKLRLGLLPKQSEIIIAFVELPIGHGKIDFSNVIYDISQVFTNRAYFIKTFNHSKLENTLRENDFQKATHLEIEDLSNESSHEFYLRQYEREQYNKIKSKIASKIREYSYYTHTYGETINLITNSNYELDVLKRRLDKLISIDPLAGIITIESI